MPTRVRGFAARTFAKDGAVAPADAWFDGVVRGIEAEKPLAAQLAARLEELSGATLEGWMAESCRGSYPLAVTASSRSPENDVPADGSFLVLTVELTRDSGPWIGSAPLIVGGPAR